VTGWDEPAGIGSAAARTPDQRAARAAFPPARREPSLGSTMFDVVGAVDDRPNSLPLLPIIMVKRPSTTQRWTKFIG
jgi:hypothetical protein